MSYEFAKKEIGDYRITVFQDEDAESPCTAWDLAGVYFWDYPNYGYNRKLSCYCSREVDEENAEDSLKKLVYNYVSQKKIIDYINSENVENFRMRYDKADHMWYLENLYDGKWYEHDRLSPYDVKNDRCTDDLCDILEEDEKIDSSLQASDFILKKRIDKTIGKNIFYPSVWHENKSGNISILDHACALRAGSSYNYLLINGTRRPSSRELLRFQGFPDSYRVVVSHTEIRRQTGNSVAVPMIRAVAKKIDYILENIKE